ncbi:hypothetical protein NPIL_133391 [Nephila pilipes]|uniref:Uncharacterized protein n=1 Tax=Nephila pilipes TaxID=299642 RepID=A0A8X6UFZ4_NEPPI|nr:hypothetical protein NPIL_133391 [Nephila pilipes]
MAAYVKACCSRTAEMVAFAACSLAQKCFGSHVEMKTAAATSVRTAVLSMMKEMMPFQPERQECLLEVLHNYQGYPYRAAKDEAPSLKGYHSSKKMRFIITVWNDCHFVFTAPPRQQRAPAQAVRQRNAKRHEKHGARRFLAVRTLPAASGAGKGAAASSAVLYGAAQNATSAGTAALRNARQVTPCCVWREDGQI